MIITVGNLHMRAHSVLLLSCMVLCFSSIRALTIKLKLTTVEGAPLQQAAAGKPFLLNVVVTDAHDSAQYPVLKGIENFHVRQSGFQLNMVNGSTSVTYHYRIRIDTPGTYTLGPAQLTHENAVVESEPLSIMVAGEEKSSAPVRTQSTGAAPIIKLSCAPNTAFVGQKIPAQLAFYTSDATTTLQSIGEPELNDQSGFIIKNKQQHPTTGTEKMNGIEYRFAKWNFDVYATKPGSLTLPAFSADYTSSAGKPMLSFFFKSETKRAYSNTCTLDIKPLPHSYKNPALVGTISDFEAHIHPSHARVGEGMVLTINLSGAGDFEHLGMLPLELPESYKWYESKKYMDGQQRYTMEYIIQATQPGTHEIPQQALYYFDTQEHTYKTIHTRPLNVYITGTPVSPAHETALDTQGSPEPDILAPLAQTGPIQRVPQGIIPWTLFWITIAICGALWILCMLVSFKKNILKDLFWYLVPQKSIYAQARTQIQMAFSKKEYAHFYALVQRLFAKRLDVSHAALTPELMVNSLLQDGLSKQAVDDWSRFYEELARVSFYRPELDQEYYHELVQKIGYWIDVLEKLPRVRS